MSRRWTRARLGALLPILAPVALLAGVLAGVSRQVIVPDTWVALVSGREIAGHGLPHVEHLTVLAQGHGWVDQQWLAQLTLYALQQAGGLGVAIAVSNLAVVVAYALAARAAQERGATPAAILGFLILAFAAAPWGVQARTQALALPLFALVLGLVLRDPGARRASTLWVLPVIGVWGNMHGSVVLGAALVSVYGAEAFVRDRRNFRAAALAVLAPVAVFASPYATGLPGYYATMLIHPPYGHDIVEWQRTTPSGITAIFFALAAVTLALLVLRRRRVSLIDWLLLGLTFATALSAVRLIPWFALAALAIASPLVSVKPGRRFHGKAADALACVAVAGIIAAAAWTGTHSYVGSTDARTLTAVRSAARGGDVFADLMLADWLLWEIPELRGRVAYDGRPEILTRQQFKGVIAVARRTPGWRAQVRGYDVLVIPRPRHHRLDLKGWRRVSTDENVVVYRRTGG